MHKPKAILFTISFLLVSINVFAQAFKTDWKNFKAPINWKVGFISKGEDYLGVRTAGDLIFQNEIDTSLAIRYHVFSDFLVDSAFLINVRQHKFLQSCVGSVKVDAFFSRGYYYLPTSCNTCLTSLIGSRLVNAKNNNGKQLNNCELLALEITKFNQTKTNKF